MLENFRVPKQLGISRVVLSSMELVLVISHLTLRLDNTHGNVSQELRCSARDSIAEYKREKLLLARLPLVSYRKQSIFVCEQ
jgi:hypothetical protein